MFTIGQVAKKYTLSRSTLIYYDTIGLLSPSARSPSNYRLYSSSDVKKMERIVLFRSAGLPLDAIATLLENESDDLDTVLENRLFAINAEIQALRQQQKIILKLLEVESAIKDTRVMTKDAWVALLEAAGLDEAGMWKWHAEFEKTAPEAHQDFLESIGIDDEEIEAIRTWAKAQLTAGY